MYKSILVKVYQAICTNNILIHFKNTQWQLCNSLDILIRSIGINNCVLYNSVILGKFNMFFNFTTFYEIENVLLTERKRNSLENIFKNLREKDITVDNPVVIMKSPLLGLIWFNFSTHSQLWYFLNAIVHFSTFLLLLIIDSAGMSLFLSFFVSLIT